MLHPDLTDKLGKDFAPATGALIAPIELASGTKAYFVGKPNPIMMRHGRKLLDCERKDTAIVGCLLYTSDAADERG